MFSILGEKDDGHPALTQLTLDAVALSDGVPQDGQRVSPGATWRHERASVWSRPVPSPPSSLSYRPCTLAPRRQAAFKALTRRPARRRFCDLTPT